ncbi:aminotransferase class V-fold PLP-dependent enzyme [Bacillus velezensis]|uniref:aminotransferase class V-fold PLP-dependent enzyme n=1 Tax=Bacillus TaxID=1386 RepID=UPI00044F5955|nr:MULTISPECIES: aminotransferase class V-fold PLP-dependent enzyme [Bacillus]AWG37106.1 perosamine synthetase [Bacillus velezensis]EYB36249.1 perosamine synthetase [Bacillus amyloliquefaciens EBL11]MCG0589432.1 aminotransferase class V-fold PLP-dependent enzyme [Bacillus velezensis]MEC0930679.1 aminotransferase class V-fold PLP-dependent enzyme [Bacillus velezensis]MEC0972718.1 aminotransferase class V-fold PLP-dependent enzyme [Bacillus velezensis]
MKDKSTNFHFPKNPEVVKYPVYPGQFSVSGRLRAVKHLLTAGQSGLTEKLEKRYGKGVVLTSSGSAALVLALTYSGAGPGKEVIFSSFSCPNVIDAVLQSGATPVFAQLDEHLFLSFEDVKKKVTRRTCAVILTHVYGRRENTAIIDWAKENGIAVIDDAAQAMFTKQADTFAGGLGDFGILSFGPSKPLASIGGGALIAPKEWLRQKANLPMEQRSQVAADYRIYIRNQRIQAVMKRKRHHPISYMFRKAGAMPSMKATKLEALPDKPAVVPVLRMHPAREAIIDDQLSRIDQLVTASLRNLETAGEIFAKAEETNGIRMIQPQEGEHLNYLTIVFPRDEERYGCSVYLAERGIQTCWNYLPLGRIPIYETYAGEGGEDPLWKRVLSLPFKPPLQKEQVRYIAESVLSYCEQQNKTE